MSKDQILVIGSVGFDMVFNIHGKIREKILLKNGSIDKLDLLFTADNLVKRFGGTAGNISYGLAKLGEQPLMFSVVGDDYQETYKQRVKDLGIQDLTHHIKEEYTATFYAISDTSKELIGVWQPNSHANIDKYSLNDKVKNWQNIKYAICSPGTPLSILKHMKEVKEHAPHTTLIFDPGQIVNLFTQEQFDECISLADIVIGNEVEIPIMKSQYGYDMNKFENKNVKIVITTKGEDGVDVYEDGETTSYAAITPKKFVEATGAGDAFRAGLLYGLINNISLKESVKIGIKLGSKNVEHYGGQEYSITAKDI